MNVDRSAAMWNSRYETGEFLYGKEPNDFLVSAAPKISAAGRVLCLADGEGRNGVYLASLGFDVVTIDQSATGVAKAQQFAQDQGVNLDAQVGDLGVADLGLSKWDAIVSIFVHLPPDVRRDLHRRVELALKGEGVFLLEAYAPDQVGRSTGGPPVAELTMTLDGLRRELSELTEEHGTELVRPVVEGSGHTGDGSVVQFIGRRR